ncbi:MAG: gamma-glutamyltransferase family protein [Treponema sp.]|nr:gamma-glutamyltransferase family protein [Treponema sp.]
MNFDPSYLPYRSIRYPVYAREGMVASSSPLASSVGLGVLQGGGNAIDAAVAAAAALTVTEPCSNGIGGDAFALIWSGGKLHGLNASGRAPMKLSIDKLLSQGHREIPMYGWAPTMVPGAPKAWASLAQRFGKLPLKRSLEGAIHYAQEGFPLTPNLPSSFRGAARIYSSYGDNREVFKEWFRTFMPWGKDPQAGDILVLPHHARTLQAIGESGAQAFYEGELAERIIADSDELGGYFCREDFSSYDVEWVDPISLNYRGYDVWEIPPNGQGVAVLAALNILNNFSFNSRDHAETYHLQWEAMKLAFSDVLAHLTDVGSMKEDYREWLSPGYGKTRAAEIGPRASLPQPLKPPMGGTVYLAAADKEGNMVSYIQSNYRGFGSGVVVRDTGISLQNRGWDFSMDRAAANALEPGKKCYHTIIPGFLTREGRPLGPFGVMGGYMQPQGHLQILSSMIDFNLNPQQALDAPRWMWLEGASVQVEAAFNAEIAKALAKRGHRVSVSLDTVDFGRGQIILRDEKGVLIGATEGRTDGSIAAL